MTRSLRPRLLPLVVTFALLVGGGKGCVLTCVALAVTRDAVPPQEARLEGGPGALRLVVEERGGPRTVRYVLYTSAPPSSLRVAGGPVACGCRCHRRGYGLVDVVEPRPYAVVDTSGARVASAQALDPFRSRGSTWATALLALTIPVDVVLFPVEAVLVALLAS